MRAIPKALLAMTLLCSVVTCASAQAGTHPPTPRVRKAPPAYRSECLNSVGFCISVPAAWQRLGDIFGDLGFVAAEPHAGADPTSWPQLTIAAIDLAAKEENGTTPSDREPPSLDVLVERMLTPEGALASAHILERGRLLLNGANAQIVRVELGNEAGKPDAIEKIALIEGEDRWVYSIALRCSPPDFERLAPVFDQAARSWRLQAEAAEPARAPKTSPGVRRPSSPTPNRIPNP